MWSLPVSFVLSASGLAACFVASATMDEGLMGAVLKFGALALCAYMVFQNYRIQEKQQDRLDGRDQRIEKLHVETLEVIRKCAGPRKEGES